MAAKPKIEGVTPDQRYDSYERTQFNPDPEKIKLSTDLTPEQVFVHAAVERLCVDSLNDWYLDLGVTELVYEIELRSISKNRLSRGEAVEVYKEQPPREEAKGSGVFGSLLGRR